MTKESMYSYCFVCVCVRYEIRIDAIFHLITTNNSWFYFFGSTAPSPDIMLHVLNCLMAKTGERREQKSDARQRRNSFRILFHGMKLHTVLMYVLNKRFKVSHIPRLYCYALDNVRYWSSIFLVHV